MNTEGLTMIPPEVLEKIKQHKEHHPDVTCLECGYKGMMGVKSDGARLGLSALIALIFTIGFMPFGLYGLIWSPVIFGFCFAISLQRTAKPIVTCPVCEKDLQI